MDYFDYTDAETADGSWDIDIEEFIEQAHEAEQQRLENELERIDDELGQRESIHEETVDELESKLDWYIDRLKKLYKWHSLDEERETVKSRIREFYRELREEKRVNWQDRQQLKRERREILEELDELDLDQVFDDILE